MLSVRSAVARPARLRFRGRRSRLCASSNGTHGSPSSAAPLKFEQRSGRKSRTTQAWPREVAGWDQKRAAVVTATSALAKHRTRAPKGCLTKYRSQRFGARAPSLFDIPRRQGARDRTGAPPVIIPGGNRSLARRARRNRSGWPAASRPPAQGFARPAPYPAPKSSPILPAPCPVRGTQQLSV